MALAEVAEAETEKSHRIQGSFILTVAKAKETTSMSLLLPSQLGTEQKTVTCIHVQIP